MMSGRLHRFYRCPRLFAGSHLFSLKLSLLYGGKRAGLGRGIVSQLCVYVEFLYIPKLLLRCSKGFQSEVAPWTVLFTGLFPVQLCVVCDSTKLCWLNRLAEMVADFHLRWWYCCGDVEVHYDCFILVDGDFVLCGPVCKPVQGVL